MSLAPMSSAGSAAADASAEVLSASLAKKKQVMEGQSAMQLLNTAAQAGPKPPSGASGHNVNVVV